MTNKPDLTVLILRFIFGAVLGALLVFVLMVVLIWWNVLIPPKSLVLSIGGAVTLIVAISATIWGDECLLFFMKLFGFLKYFF